MNTGRKPGRLIMLPDNRIVVMYNEQPLYKSHKKVLLHLLDEDFKPVMENGKQKTIIKTIDEFNNERSNYTAIGMVD